MTERLGLEPPIFRIDLDAVQDFLGVEVALGDIPGRIVGAYNLAKEAQVFVAVGRAEYDGCQLAVYRNAQARANPISWPAFYEPSGITIAPAFTQSQHLLGFIAVDDELYVHTGGHSIAVFERFVDLSFPIDVARRIAQPEVKRARSSQISGTTLASDVNFRDPRRITYTESLENVWTALSGQVRPDVLAEDGMRAVFGTRKRMRMEVGSAIRFGPRVVTLDKLIALIRWLAVRSRAAPPDEDEWAILDSIKVLNPRKSKDQIARLREALADKLVVRREFVNMAVTHADASLYANADRYVASRGRQDLYSGELRPELGDILDGVDPGPDGPMSLLTSIAVRSESTDAGSVATTDGTLLHHLHGEIRHDDRTWFVLAGRWYEVDRQYIDSVTRDFVGLIGALDLDASSIGLRRWQSAETEGDYNETSAVAATVVNGDKVLTDNVEFFDTLISTGERTFLIHVKRGFDVKVRDVRSQIVNAANIIENDLRASTPTRLKRHYQALVRRGRTAMPEDEFLAHFALPRTYVLAYGTETKVTRDTVDRFGSTVARMEVVALNGQFRQITSTNQTTELRIAWIEMTD